MLPRSHHVNVAQPPPAAKDRLSLRIWLIKWLTRLFGVMENGIVLVSTSWFLDTRSLPTRDIVYRCLLLGIQCIFNVKTVSWRRQPRLNRLLTQCFCYAFWMFFQLSQKLDASEGLVVCVMWYEEWDPMNRGLFPTSILWSESIGQVLRSVISKPMDGTWQTSPE